MLRRGTDRAMRGKEIQRCRIEKRAMRSSTPLSGYFSKETEGHFERWESFLCPNWKYYLIAKTVLLILVPVLVISDRTDGVPLGDRVIHTPTTKYVFL